MVLVADLFGTHSELAREKVWSRIHLIPMLQAEEDRDLVRRHWADQAREKELLGGQSKVYHSDRYVPTMLRPPKLKTYYIWTLGQMHFQVLSKVLYADHPIHVDLFDLHSL